VDKTKAKLRGLDKPMGTTNQTHLQMHFRKVTRLDNKEVLLDADMIRLLIAIDEKKPLGKIAQEVGMSPEQINVTIDKLLELKLVEPVLEKAKSSMGGHFVKALQQNLSRAVGPMAQIILEDALSDLNLTGKDIPQNQAAELISLLAVEIPDEEIRMQFKKAMLPLIKA
jgi:molybdenum-dependent DNA-binding transcriptional regulator ModE